MHNNCSIWNEKMSTKMSIIFLSMCDVKVSDIYFTEFGAALTTVLPVLFKYCYKYCYSDSRKMLWNTFSSAQFYSLIISFFLTYINIITIDDRYILLNYLALSNSVVFCRSSFGLFYSIFIWPLCYLSIDLLTMFFKNVNKNVNYFFINVWRKSVMFFLLFLI
jgi:hypothetical protein